MKIAIFFSLESESHEKMMTSLSNLKFMNLADHELHLIHVFKKEFYPFNFTEVMYPNAEQEEIIKKEVSDMLSKFATTLNLKNFRSHCLFSEDPREFAVDFLEELGADLAVGLTKERSGFEGYFHSSFTEYLINHSKCDVFVIK